MKRNINSALRLIGICLFFILITTGAFAFQWPVQNLAITATFGESRWGHFHSGIDIGGGEQEIRPIEDGELIFFHEEGSGPLDLPTGLGNFLVVEHERGIRSLYAHMRPDTLDPQKTDLVKSDVIGIIGETGSSLGKHLHFEVVDREFHQLVNPIRLLPALTDTTAPSIGIVELRRDTITQRIETGDRIISGKWSLVLEVYDVSEYVSYFCPMAPYLVQVYLNGSKALAYVYESLEEHNGKLELVQSEGQTFDTLYLDDWLSSAGDITVPEGEVQIEEVASDYSGNESSRVISLFS
ncbi:MAG: M23 family metallopeptidase, partial [Spirochaetales bacterium]|nr:M23 family metallopeptidase [Spirochaetales bacterium]